MRFESNCIFYHPKYLQIQQHENLNVFENDRFGLVVSVEGKVATSLPRGLFGSFEVNGQASEENFSEFFQGVTSELLANNVSKLIIAHPPTIYNGFVPDEWLIASGCSIRMEEINHHIDFKDYTIHPMETRKMNKLKNRNFNVEKVATDRLQEAYMFLAECRKEMKLELNVSYKRLVELFEQFPEQYSIFFATLEGQLASVVITVQTSENVVYYYLPGTLSKFKKDSPMVGLMQSIIDYFKSRLQFLDLGVSSINGSPQDGLIDFKERMGGLRTEKRIFSLNLNQPLAR